MSLELFKKSCLQSHHSDVLCKRVALATLSVSSLGVAPHQVFQAFHCTLQLCQHGSSKRKDFSEQPSGSSSCQGIPIACASAARLQALLLIQSQQGCRTTLLRRGSSTPCTADLLALAEFPAASLRSLPTPLPTCHLLFPRPTSGHLLLLGARSPRSSLCAAPRDTKSLSVFYSGGGLPRPFDVLQGWLFS